MDTKQKKQLITISLAGAVLLAGLVAGFLVVQNGVFIQNRASTGPISCQPIRGKCTVDTSSSSTGFTPYTIEVKNASGTVIATSGQNATEISFIAEPLQRYTCEVVAVSPSTCKKTTEADAPLCAVPLEVVTPPPPTQPVIVPKITETGTPTPTVPAQINAPSATATPIITQKLTLITVTATPTARPATGTPAAGTPTSGTGGSGITPTGLPTSGPTNAPTATAAVQATRAAATATQAAVQTQASNPSATKAASTTSLPASGNVHPALIFGMLSVFIIVLGLLF